MDDPDYSPDQFRRCIVALGNLAGLIIILAVAVVAMAIYGG